MTNVLVICGAGASSTFLVHWLRADAANRGFDATFTAGALEGLPAQLATTDLVLVGSHLTDHFDDISERAAAAGARAILLPVVGFDAAGAAIALDLVEQDAPITNGTGSTSHA